MSEDRLNRSELFELYRDGKIEDSLQNWQRCNFCGEMYHVLSGHYVPNRGISACELCVKAGKLKPDSDLGARAGS
jgi:hypothetical protein